MAELMHRNNRGVFPFFDRDLDDVFEGFFRPMRGGASPAAATGALVPAIDVTEHEDHWLVHAELPGFDKDDIDVSLQDGQLTISAETKSEQTDENAKGGRRIVRERRFGRFVRSLAVGDNVDPESIKASYKDGILEVNVPKPTEVSPSARRIAVE